MHPNSTPRRRHGRGLKGTGISTPSSVAAATPEMTLASAAPMAAPLLGSDARFLPIEMCAPARVSNTGPAGRGDTAAPGAPTIDIELRRGPASLGVRWPVSAAGDCAAWLREVAVGLVK